MWTWRRWKWIATTLFVLVATVSASSRVFQFIDISFLRIRSRNHECLGRTNKCACTSMPCPSDAHFLCVTPFLIRYLTNVNIGVRHDQPTKMNRRSNPYHANSNVSGKFKSIREDRTYIFLWSWRTRFRWWWQTYLADGFLSHNMSLMLVVDSLRGLLIRNDCEQK